MREKDPTPKRSPLAAGTWYAIAAFSAWGLLPLYWKALQEVPAEEILAHRVLWSAVVAGILVLIMGGWTDLRDAISRCRSMLAVLLGSILIGGNWFIAIPQKSPR